MNLVQAGQMDLHVLSRVLRVSRVSRAAEPNARPRCRCILHMSCAEHVCQPCWATQNDEIVPGDALCVVQPFHPGVLNILYPYDSTLAKQRALKRRTLVKPLHGRFDSQMNPAASSSVP